ncbi:flagellar hook-associated protein FlgK [Teredinibacter haidensis]|uniref:flagellar hook-associated protein FlgK n=1 Tax=Teredinibacter haidensis TaxID=2731755 RepID=UPI000949148C|nr:flagellar hook-associated protein FlgK [Teredinibacter haidensis]
MSSDLLGVSISGIRVTQSALNTTGHNISNAGVDGYSRQRVNVQTNPATFAGNGYVGNGANVKSIERIVNSFVTEQLRDDTTLYKDLDIYHTYVSQLDDLLSDASTGLASGMESFFASMQNGLDDPTSIPARQLILSESENLADRFNTMYSRFQTIDNNVDESLAAGIAHVNALVSNVAELNLKISNAMGVSDGNQPNDLLDQRDEALRQLSELISIQTYDEGLGQINVVVGNGQNLVVGTEARHLALQPSAEDVAKQDVVFKGDVGGQVVTKSISGGEIGGLLRFRDGTMDQVYNEFGRIAVVMADSFNEAHQQGITLENEFGGLFFYDVNDSRLAAARVIGNSNNAESSESLMRLNISDSQQLTDSDYDVKIESGGLYRIERLNDGKEVATGLLPGSFPFSVEFDGLELVFDGGTFQDGDSFKLQPVRTAGRDFSSSLVNAQSIAFASPLLTDASIGNSGSGVISPGEILSLTAADGSTLPLLANAGQMNPPLVVRFTSPTSYDVLDNSDPGNPVQLNPPIRDQRFIVGVSNNVFGTDPGATLVSSNGELTGLPEGRMPVSQAALLMGPPAAVAPDFTVSDFSGTANQFSFDVVVSGTPDGLSDGTFSITISGPAIVDENVLLSEINAQLNGTGVTGFIADNGTVGFRLNSAGYGDLTLQNYNSDPDGNGDLAPLGQANNLLGLNIEGASLTTVGNTNGVTGAGFLSNGYPAEAITLSRPSATVGAAPLSETIFTNQNASAKEIASALSNVAGVTANAFNYVEMSNLRISNASPLQIQLNGEDLVEYETDSLGNPVVASNVPSPLTDTNAFNDYLAERISENPGLQAAGIYAVPGRNAVTGAAELRVYSSEGDDFELSLTAAVGESIDISDGRNPNTTLNAVGNSVATSMVIGGQLDVTLADDISLSTFPPHSMIFGDTTAADFARSDYYGIQAAITGIPDTGDTFTLDFNVDAASDNRNALSLVNLASGKTVDGGVSTYAESYGALVEKVGIDTASAQINVDASEQVLHQSTQMRASVSGVNLDEEAANLIRFEQMYAANTQVISVARDLFDRLINSF